MSQQNTVLIDDIMSALDAESSQNVELIVRNTQNGATRKMALSSLESIIYSYLTSSSVASQLASVLGVLGRVTNVPANSDLLQYIINPGIYTVNNAATARTITNGPITDGGYSVVVHRHHSSYTPVIAVAYCNQPKNIPKVAVKAYVSDIWGAWTFLVHE